MAESEFKVFPRNGPKTYLTSGEYVIQVVVRSVITYLGDH